MDITQEQHKQLMDVLIHAVKETLGSGRDSDTIYDIALDAYTELLEEGIEYPFTVGPQRAASRAKNFLRDEDRRREIEDENPGLLESMTPSSFPDPMDVLMAEQRLHKLDDLTPQLLETLELYYIDGLSIKEIAAKEGASESAVKVRLHRAREIVKGE